MLLFAVRLMCLATDSVPVEETLECLQNITVDELKAFVQQPNELSKSADRE